jgi:glycosyltransferase involved in cell wall biosynthesis
VTELPEITVVIATRNRWPLLSAHALPSALRQEDVVLEVVVVDDGSTDGTDQRLVGVGDERLRVVRHQTARGLPAARNAGAAAARGEWLAFLDDDDLWSPRKLRLQLDAAAAQGACWAYGAAVVVDGAARPIGADPLPGPAEVASLLLQGNFVPGGGSNVIVRADAFHRAGGFDEELRFFEDWDLWLRLAQQGLPAVCPEVVMARVEHGRNMVLRERRQVMGAYERLMSRQRPVTRADRLAVAEWVAHEHHRAGRRLRAALLYLRAAVEFRSPGNLPPAAGALLGRAGMALASRLLVSLRGASHLGPVKREAPPDPGWLAAFR